jgi:integrase
MWVFCDVLGGPIRASNVLRRSFLPLLKRAGLPRIRFHDLRHTAATLMLRQGIHPKIVQERLGHSQIAMTMDIYSHVLPSMQREAADRLDVVFSRA